MPSYRKSTQNRRSNRNYSGTASLGWVWLFLGMLLGILMAIFLYGVFTQQWTIHSLVQKRTVHKTEAAPSTKTSSTTQTQSTHTNQSSQHAHHLKPGKKEVNKEQQYEFYTLLPGMEVQLPAATAATSSTAATSATAANSSHSGNSSKTTVTPSPAHTTVTVPNHTAPKQSPELAQKPKAITKSVPNNKLSQVKETQAKELQNKVVQNKNKSPQTKLPQTNKLSHTKPKTKPQHHAEVQTRIAASQYIIQAGIFTESKNAEELKARLVLRGFSPHIQKLRNAKGEILYRVTLGPFSSEPSALSQKKRLSDHKIHGILILQRSLV